MFLAVLSPKYLGFQVCFRRRNHPWNCPRCFGTVTNPSHFPSPAPACCFMDEKFQQFHSSPGFAPGKHLPLKTAQHFQSNKNFSGSISSSPFPRKNGGSFSGKPPCWRGAAWTAGLSISMQALGIHSSLLSHS